MVGEISQRRSLEFSQAFLATRRFGKTDIDVLITFRVKLSRP